MKGTLANQSDPHGGNRLTWRSDTYTDANGADWRVFADGADIWHVQPADNATVVYYAGKQLREGGDMAFAEGLDMLVDAIDAFVEGYNAAQAAAVKANAQAGAEATKSDGLFALILLLALVFTDKKGRR